jgi:hypothetical protein
METLHAGPAHAAAFAAMYDGKMSIQLLFLEIVSEPERGRKRNLTYHATQLSQPKLQANV